MEAREENTEADDLTNGDFTKFDMSLRRLVSFSDLKLDLFEELMACYDEYESSKVALKSVTQLEKASKKQKLAEKTPW